MQNDLISRSEVIAQLEGFKLSLGDVILRLVVDRVIERVKAQPAVAAPLKLDEWEETDSRKLYDAAMAAAVRVPRESHGVRECSNCKHFDESASDYPCSSCSCRDDGDPTCWEMMPDENL